MSDDLRSKGVKNQVTGAAKDASTAPGVATGWTATTQPPT